MREFCDGHERLSARTSLFAECPDPALGKEILKKYKYNLCRVLKIQHSAKLLKKRKKKFLSARDPALGKVNKKPKNVCRVLARTALGKEIFLQNQRTPFKK